MLLSAELRTDSATVDPALVKERSIAQRRRVSSSPDLVDSPRIGDRSNTADYTLSGFCTRTAVVLAIFTLTHV